MSEYKCMMEGCENESMPNSNCCEACFKAGRKPPPGERQGTKSNVPTNATTASEEAAKPIVDEKQAAKATTTIVNIRFDKALIEGIEQAVAHQNQRTTFDPIDRSAWVRAACREKLAHQARSKKKGQS
jgi:hypothetical protein